MIAHKRTVEEIADELDADSLAYLSLEGVYEAIGDAARGPLRRLLHRPLPARRPRGRERQVRPRGRRTSVPPPAASFSRRMSAASEHSVVLASGRRHQPAGDPRRAARARGDRGRRGRLRQARRRALERARGGAGCETAVFPRDEYADREARDAAMGDWIEALGADLVVLAGYMQLLSAASSRRFRDRDRQRPPRAAAGLPGLDAIGQALARRGRGHRGHRALRRRGRRHRRR